VNPPKLAILATDTDAACDPETGGLGASRRSRHHAAGESPGAGGDQGEEDGVDDLLEGVVAGGGEGGEDFVA
jgi:hypothetical protein